MAKTTPETVERFRVQCEVEKDQLGHIIAELTKLGIQHVHHELVTDVLGYKKPQKFEVSSINVLREYIKTQPTFTRKDVVAHFAEIGRGEDPASNALYHLSRLGEIKKLGEGNYQRAGVKAIAGPKKHKKAAKKEAKKARPQAARYDVSNLDLILRTFRNRKSFTLKQAEALLEANGRPPQSTSPVLLKLVATHKVRRIGQGEYATIKGPNKKKKAVANGSAGEPIIAHHASAEELTNG